MSERTFLSFQELFSKRLKGEEILLLDSLGNLSRGQGKPDVVFVSYELMFKCLENLDFRQKFFAFIDGSDFVQGSWAGIESEVAKELITKTKHFCHGGGVHAITLATYVFAQMLRHVKGIDAHIELQKRKEWMPRKFFYQRGCHDKSFLVVLLQIQIDMAQNVSRFYPAELTVL